MLSSAVDEELVCENVALRPPRLGVAPEKVEVPTSEQVEAVIAAASPAGSGPIIVAATAGLRRGEVFALRYKQSSSSYHDWQRAALGGEITVADVDLLRLNDARDEVTEMIEIKRSRVSLDRWELYPEDYDNFRLLAHIASASNIPMTITYHRFTVGPPREEDTSRLTLWRVDIDKSPLVTSIGRVDLAAFARGDHLG